MSPSPYLLFPLLIWQIQSEARTQRTLIVRRAGLSIDPWLSSKYWCQTKPSVWKWRKELTEFMFHSANLGCRGTSYKIIRLMMIMIMMYNDVWWCMILTAFILYSAYLGVVRVLPEVHWASNVVIDPEHMSFLDNNIIIKINKIKHNWSWWHFHFGTDAPDWNPIIQNKSEHFSD